METMTIAQGMMHGPQGDWGGPGPLIFLPFLFLFWALFLGLLVWAAFRFLPRLRESFARGEMSAEEYERAMTTLRQDRARGYDDYVREAEERLNPERGAGS